MIRYGWTLPRPTYQKVIQNLLWATVYNVVAIRLAAGALYSLGVVLTPAPASRVELVTHAKTVEASPLL